MTNGERVLDPAFVRHSPVVARNYMTPLAIRVRASVQRQRLLESGSRVLVALSGGADSVALLFVLRELEAAGVLTLAGAAHLHHGLRGEEADGDEAFCAALTSRLGVPFVAERADVAAFARAGKRSIEDAARAVRYAFLERAAGALGADAIAVAHTIEDQAETFLLRLLRGAGTRGLGSIRPRVRLPAAAPQARGWVIRPLLDVERAALRDYLRSLGETWREDATNRDVSLARNRVRHELMPVLESRFSPSAAVTLARAAALAHDDEEFLQDQAIELARRIVLTRERSQITIDTDGLAAAPRALGSRVVLQALEQLAGGRPLSFEHVDRVMRLGEGQAVSLPGQDAVRLAEVLTLRSRNGRGSGPPKRRNREDGTSFAFSLSIPGEVQLAAAGLVVEARLDSGAGRHSKWMGRGAEVGVAAGGLELPLAVRSRRPGDRFRPLGAPGSRKLQDFFVDRKVARGERDTVPLVVDGRDRIVWVVGQSVAEDFRVTDPSRGVILLKVRHLGGVG
jgi:tRNA(Ile)-lysidine synthase